MGDVFGKSDPPPAPDYAGMARTQGAANLQSTLAQAYLNRVQQQTPFGTLRWNQDGTITIPGAEGNPAVDIPRFTSTMDFTPEGRRLFDQQTRIQTSLGDIAEGGLDRVQGVFGQPLDVSSLGQRQTGLNLSGLPALDRSGLPQLQRPDISGAPGRGQVGDLDLSGLPGRTVQPTVAGREAVTQALLDRQAPMREQRADKLRSDLVNRGFSVGDKGYDDQMFKLGQLENDERLAAIAAGGAEQSRLFGLESSARSQAQGEQQALFNADLAGGTFDNQNRRDAIAEQMAQADWAARTRGQLGGELSADRGQLFNESVAGFNAANSARGTGLQELMALRQLPLSELNAFRTGAQPQLPQFNSVPQVGAPQPAPYYQAARDTYQTQMDGYNADVAQSNSLMSGLFRLGAAAMPYAGGWFGGGIGAV